VVRVVALIVAFIFAFCGADVAWSCPTARADEGCCCDMFAPKGADAPENAGPQLGHACCCVAKQARDGAPTPPAAQPPARDGFIATPVAQVVMLATPRASTGQVAFALYRHRGPPPETLFRLHTLLLS
jgi:hypothetical protein